MTNLFHKYVGMAKTKLNRDLWKQGSWCTFWNLKMQLIKICHEFCKICWQKFQGSHDVAFWAMPSICSSYHRKLEVISGRKLLHICMFCSMHVCVLSGLGQSSAWVIVMGARHSSSFLRSAVALWTEQMKQRGRDKDAEKEKQRERDGDRIKC